MQIIGLIKKIKTNCCVTANVNELVYEKQALGHLFVPVFN